MIKLSTDAWLLTGEVVATLAVGLGILLETPENPTRRQKIAAVLVLVGVVAETFFSVALFRHDGRVIRSQRAKIIALQSRLAARSLTKEDANEISTVLDRYSGQHFEIHEYDDDQESVDIADQIASALRKAGWQQKPTPPPGTFAIAGVVAGIPVYIAADANAFTRGAATALVVALKSKHIDAKLAPMNLEPSEINVTVGIKP